MNRTRTLSNRRKVGPSVVVAVALRWTLSLSSLTMESDPRFVEDHAGPFLSFARSATSVSEVESSLGRTLNGDALLDPRMGAFSIPGSSKIVSVANRLALRAR